MHLHLSIPFILPLLTSLTTANAHSQKTQDDTHPFFPPINLTYATHTPTYINTTRHSGTKIAQYNNIRFAQPPTGPLRFRKPVSPPPHEPGIQDGRRHQLFTTDCVSSAPAMVPFPDVNGSTWGTEDCLFLNVWVPEGVRPGRDKVPVVHWLYGSAYAFGSKDRLVDGMALMEREREGERFIYVASNYRMGIYGWTSAEDEDMDANIGLHDGVAALQWTKKYIARFGGDPDNITAIGESAGGAMIAMMLVAEGGEAELPFQKAFISSPAMLPRRNVTQRRRHVFNQVLRSANCSSLDCLRHASPETLKAVNKHVLLDFPGESGGATFGPGIGLGPFPDGEYLPDAMTTLFAEGRFNKHVKAVISGNMAEEGLFTTPDVENKHEFTQLVRRLVPGASNATVQRIRALYPYPDSQIQQVAKDWTTDAVWACNAQAIAKAYAGITRRYVFSVPPASHGLDLNYLFYTDNATTPVASVAVARELQAQTLKFVHGDDVASNATGWPVYGKESSMVNITEAGLRKSVDPWTTKPNCKQIFEVIMDERNGA